MVGGQAETGLLSWTNTWHFNQALNLDGVGWTAPSYDAGGWETAEALFYVETNPMVSPRTTPLVWGRSCYYFRTHFTMPVAPTNVVLVISSRVDDGAVYYLNGQEVRRQRMPATAIQYETLATSTPVGGDATFAENFTLSGNTLTNLLPGDNVLAVELHPRGITNDDDVVFGAIVTLRFTNSPPVILSQPADLEVLDGRTALLSAVVDGSPPPTRQWYKDGAALADATGPTVAFAPARPSQAGQYWLLASNALGTATTRQATVTVLPDTDAPMIVQALAATNLTNITVDFSEPVDSASALALTNYTVVRSTSGFQALTVVSAELVSASRLVLGTSVRAPNVAYTLGVNGVRDRTSSSNLIAAGTAVPLAYAVTLVGIPAPSDWWYNDSGGVPPPEWTARAFDDRAWPLGLPLFVGGEANPALPEQARTQLSLREGASGEPVTTYYFRTRFDLTGPLQPGSLRLRGIVDDGAVFYLNGREVLALGMPTNRPTRHGDFAVRTVGTAAYEPPLSKPGSLVDESLVGPEGNVLAVELHQAEAGGSDAAFGAVLEGVVTGFTPRAELVLPPSVQEGSGRLRDQGQLVLREPRSTSTQVALTSTDPLLTVPAEVTIPAGATNALFDLLVGDDAAITGPRPVSVQASLVGGGPSSATLTLLDDETAELRLLLSGTVVEGQTDVTGEVQSSQPVARGLPIALACDRPDSLLLPSWVTLPAGATSCVFRALVPDNARIEDTYAATVTASVAGWPAVARGVGILDNEPRTLSLALPTSVVEGAGVLTNRGSVWLAGLASAPVTITVTSSVPTRLAVPPSVLIPAGQSNAVFDLTVFENDVWEGTVPVTVGVSAPKFIEAETETAVLENDAHHFAFETIPSPQTTDTPFPITIRALGRDATVVTNFTRSVALAAHSLEGEPPVEPASVGPFTRGVWAGEVRVITPGRLVRIEANLAPGQSEPFHVEYPPFKMLAQPTADLLWHAATGTLLATVPASGGAYANQIVAISPQDGAITNAYSFPGEPGTIEGSPDGSYAYVAASDRNLLTRFDLATRVASRTFSVGSNMFGALHIGDFTVVSGGSDSVVVALSDGGGNSAGVWRFNNGNPVDLDSFSTIVPYWIEAGPSGGLLYGYQNNNSFPIMRGVAQPGSAVTVRNGVLSGGALTYRDEVLYDNVGKAASAGTLASLGAYPGVQAHLADTALVETDTALDRVLFLTGRPSWGAPPYRLKAYDRSTFMLLADITAPSITGGPIRFLNLSTNGLVFNTSGGQIWFVRSEPLQPTRAPVDLVLAQSWSSDSLVIGSDVVLTLALANAGPNTATFLRVTNALPAGTVVVASEASAGTTTLNGGAVSWEQVQLDAGATNSLKLTLRFSRGGWVTNVASVTAYERDTAGANNVSTQVAYVGVPTGTEAAFLLAWGTEDLLYDPARDRLLLSIGNGLSGQSNGWAWFDPYTGTTETFTALGTKPSRLARSSDGTRLYVSLPDAARVRCFDLPAGTLRTEFELGGESHNGRWYPFYAADMAVLPGTPDSLAIWRMRQAGPEAVEYGQGIAVFDRGVMRPQTTDPGGTWSLGIASTDGTLFAYQTQGVPWWEPMRVLRQCALGAEGVSFAETYPSLAWSVGEHFKVAANRFFLSGGVAVGREPFRATTLFDGSDGSALVEPDPAGGRVFYLGNTQGNWQLRAHDLDTGELLGTLSLPGLAGIPSGLTRWGAQGLAFRTDASQLWLINSSLVSQQAQADLAIALDAPGDVVPVGGESPFRLTVNNRGPATARNVMITNLFPASMVISNFPGGQEVWSAGDLPPGAAISVDFVAVPSQPGPQTLAAAVGAATADPRRADNATRRIILAGTPWQSDVPLVAKLAANDLVWSAGRLWFTGGTNAGVWAGCLVSLDPATLQFDGSSVLGSGANRMALADDGSHLHVTLSHAVARRQLPLLTADTDILLDGLGTLYAPGDLERVRGIPTAIAVGRLLAGTGELVVFDGAEMRTNTAAMDGASFVLEASGDAATLFAQIITTGTFERYRLDAAGLTQVDAVPNFLPRFEATDLAWGDGLLYTSRGAVIAPDQRSIVGRVSGITTHSPLCYDAGARRLFFVSATATNCVLRVVDAPTLVTLETRVLSGVRGVPTRLARWGADGLAFLTAQDELVLIRSSLIPAAPPTDLNLRLTSAPAEAFVGGDSVFVLTVTNRGPNPAANVNLLARCSANAGALTVSASPGIWTLTNGNLVVHFDTLPPSGSATTTITATPVEPGLLDLRASVTSSAFDPNPADNAVTSQTSVLLAVAPDSVAVLGMSVSDVAHDPVTDQLYVAGPGSQISVILPALAQLVTAWPVPADPQRLALTDDAQALYVSMANRSRLGRLRIPTGQLDLDLSFPSGAIADFKPVPGANRSCVLAYGAGIFRQIEVWDDAVLRPGAMSDSSGADSLVFGQRPDRVYANGSALSGGRRMRTLALDVGGVREITWNEDVPYDLDALKFAGEYLYESRGRILEPETLRVMGQFDGLGTDPTVEPDLEQQRVFFVSRLGAGLQLQSFDANTRQLVGALSLTSVAGQPASLVRWGADGLAFCTSSNQLVLVRTQLAAGRPAADLALGAIGQPTGPVAGHPFELWLTVTNLGPQAAAGIRVTLGLPPQTSLQSTAASHGIARLAGAGIEWEVGDVAAGVTATNRLVLLPSLPGIWGGRDGQVSSRASDTNFHNNLIRDSWIVHAAADDTPSRLISLVATDLAWHPTTGLLHASLGANAPGVSNALITLNPATGRFGTPFAVGPDPGRLAMSEDGQFLYVGLNDTASVARVKLDEAAVDLEFPLHAGYQARDLQVMPGQPRTVAAAREYFPWSGAGDHAGVALYRDGVELPESTPLYTEVMTSLAWAPNGLRLYGYNGLNSEFGFRRLSVSTSGVVLQDATPGLIAGYGVTLQAAGDLLYASSGTILDPQRLTVVTNLAGIGAGARASVDVASKSLTFVTPSGADWHLRAYALDNYALRAECLLPGWQGTARQLVRWGEDRWAALSTSNQLFLVRLSLADADADGMPDAWELAHSLDPANPDDARLDNDQDGLTNVQEYQAATDPNRAASVLRIVSCVPTADAVRLRFTTVPGKTYDVESSPALSSPRWTPVVVAVPAAEYSLEVRLPNDATDGVRFCRVRLRP